MLRIQTSYDATQAKAYFTESLSRGDYYETGQEMPGCWGGILAAELGLRDEVRQADFFALCNNRHPETKEPLTPRDAARRRVGYDINLHVPKSVTIAYSLGGDERILPAVWDSVRETMQDAEQLMRTRVRVDGENSDRVTSNALWAGFVHGTARPVKGLPDPHLHVHCFTFNVTRDHEENRLKAGEFLGIKQQAPLLQARFLLRVASRLNSLGYELYPSGKFWELDGIPDHLNKEFSRRTAEINKLAAKLGIKGESAAGLGATTREKKQKHIPMDVLRDDWRKRAGEEGLKAIQETVRKAESRTGVRPGKEDAIARECVAFAVAHVFETKSAVKEQELLEECCKRAAGRTTLEAVEAAFRSEPFVRRTFQQTSWLTTERVLAEEQKMLSFEKEGRGSCQPIVRGVYDVRDELLNHGQRAAVRHVLNSYDKVMFILGSSGSGKTRLMTEAIDAAKRSGLPVMVLSPLSNVARQTLPKEGFKDAETIASFLLSKDLHEKHRGGLLWVDEAGLLGTQTVNQLFNLSEQYDTRVVFSGSPAQHKPHERGDALRILVDEGGVQAAEVTEIVRQKGEYKKACEHLNKGDILNGWRVLEGMGSIVEVKGERGIDEAHRALAKEYVKARRAGRSVQAIAPTHAEGEQVTKAIRGELYNTGFVGLKDKEFLKLKPLYLSEAEKMDPATYKPGMVVQFHGKSRGKLPGQRGEVIGTTAGVVFITGAAGKATPLPLKLSDASRFSVYEQATIKLAIGDSIRITRNGKAVGDLLNFLPDRRNPLRSGRQLWQELGESLGIADKEIRPNPKRVNNGEVFRIIGLTPIRNDLVLHNGYVIDRNFGHISHGYCSTSQDSQSKTVQDVFLAQTSMSFGPAASQEQALVSISRGSHGCKVFTNDKDRLLDEWHRCGKRMSASEMLSRSQDEMLNDAVRHRENLRRARENQRAQDRGQEYER